ncbi:galactose mutarotase-like protein [Sistotremastrum niveocremeum HHB9708]|uniref:Glucose-6-phosphate 1-epimerase n=1 Tax=Sistotremastrum niveocremeum HHB9708 TaxID=1314777 RepID=A0A164U7D2_9AGAM|nr:galactose mutarotase-like protein [Sistotremastrum niveocremeum HHB9708]
MPVTQTESTVQLIHPKGSSVEILLYGATVVSWKSASVKGAASPVERLFVSSKSFLDGSKPVRGGIPICFPIFGPPQREEHSKLSQHGFARSEVWTFDRVLLDDDAGVSVKLVLNPSPAATAKFPNPFKLSYVVTLAEHQLSTDLHVENPGPSTLTFQALLHTYHRGPAQLAAVTPLKGLTYIDKVRDAGRFTEDREAVDVHKFTDSVYVDAPGKYHIGWEGADTVEIKSKNFNDVVVWNPGPVAGGKLADMEENGWDTFICVEPGTASYFVDLEASKSWIGQQVITIL